MTAFRGAPAGARPLLYIAAPLFNPMERRFNEDLAHRLALNYQVFLPQRDGQLISDLVADGLAANKAAESVFRADMAALRQCWAVVAVLDGRTIDEGVAFEIGVGSSLGKRCVGLQTDVRRLLPFGNNPMIECALSATFADVDALMTWLERSHVV